ncbi:LOW QUALITY PROTEIN: Hypothetical protein PHPALM_14014 [Phytophthora palmivora]|uniref:Uncharacterized protein n=1 Tax=Phytophthora palmivora TaxID=4796 RepID=A0A2P4XVV7_9STRA|nr:LOW QUALITY PROTEIN: Hypothetical protein PHPALM_14014 [Phytophthora palmivora]
MSGASQVASNTMRTTQVLLSRMESNQAHLGQQVQQAFHAIQALAVRGSPSEGQSSLSVPDLEVICRRGHLLLFQLPGHLRYHERLMQLALKSHILRWSPRESSSKSAGSNVKRKAEAEKVAWVADVQKILSAQLEAFRQKIQSLEEARNRDQETIRDLKNVQEMRSRNTPATHPQVQDTRVTYGSDSATQIKSEPTRVTMYPPPGSAIKGYAGERRDIKCDSDFPNSSGRLFSV